MAYDLPNTASAGRAWGTGRGNFKRTGTSPVPVPLISAADASIAEGNSGQATLKIPLTLSLPTSVPVSVSYATADGTATAGSDYVATAGTLTIPAGVHDGRGGGHGQRGPGLRDERDAPGQPERPPRTAS